MTSHRAPDEITTRELGEMLATLHISSKVEHTGGNVATIEATTADGTVLYIGPGRYVPEAPEESVFSEIELAVVRDGAARQYNVLGLTLGDLNWAIDEALIS